MSHQGVEQSKEGIPSQYCAERHATILVVDDEDAARCGVARCLTDAGYTVSEAASLSEARKRITDTSTDLLVLDVDLPDGNGLDFCAELRANPATALIPIIQVSATFTQGRDYARGLDAGADNYLFQPVEPVMLLATVRSLFRARRVEAERAHLAAVVENADEPIISKDLDGNITSWNPAAERMLGYTPAEIIGRPITWIIPEELHAEELEILTRLRKGERIPPRETLCLHRDGRRIEVSLTISPVRDEAGRIVGASSLLHDISERRRSRQELERQVAERTARLRETIDDLEHFSYTITHDLRAPLRAMRSFGQILLTEYPDSLDDLGRDYLHRIVESSKRMDHLITDSLSFAKVAKREMPLAPVNTETLLKGILDSYPEFRPPRADVRIEDGLPWVIGNKAGLTQCFSNLLSNAVKFVQPGKCPQVRISAEQHGQRVRLWIRDNGIGISPEGQKKIFTIFQRLSAEHEGTGIGLALVRKVVERMRGKVGVESEPGKGSGFWVELKASPPASISSGSSRMAA